MIKILRSRLALSTVVTTLIILVVSVLLAGVVTYFAINVTSTRVEEESLHLRTARAHIWYDGVNRSLAGLIAINTGGRDLVIDKINVRGQECPWNHTTGEKYVVYAKTTDTISADLPYVASFNRNSTPTQVTIGGTTYDFTVATDDLVLQEGWTMIIYIVNPDSISINHIGLTVGIELFTTRSTHHIEINVECIT
jgi:hypothetical protein